jgi:hypothetical protein
MSGAQISTGIINMLSSGFSAGGNATPVLLVRVVDHRGRFRAAKPPINLRLLRQIVPS